VARPQRRLQLRVQFLKMLFDRAPLSRWRSSRAQRAAWFGRRPDGARDLYRIGPHAELIGQPAAAAPVAAEVHRVALRDEQLFRDQDPRRYQVPALVRGEIRTAAGAQPPPGPAIAVAVNGTCAPPRGPTPARPAAPPSRP
jgi:hypothetical protein